MAAPKKVTFVIGARDTTRAVFRRVGRAFRSLARAVVSFRGLVVGVFAGAATKALVNFAQSMENVQDSAESLGLTTEEMQALIFAAKEVGVSGRDIETVFQRLSRRAGQAADGNALLLDKFLKLGLTLDDLKNKSSLDLFDDILANVRELPKAVGEARIADILDTEGLRLIRRVLPEFTDFADILSKAKAAGAILSAEDLQAMEDFSRAVREFQVRFAKEIAPAISEFTKKVTPHIPALAQRMGELAGAINRFIDDPGSANPLRSTGQALGSGAASIVNTAKRGELTAGGRLINQMLEGIDELVNQGRRAELKRNTGADISTYS